jgi:hypothetical protein
MLVTAYIVERGLILEPYEVESKTNEITALPAFIKVPKTRKARESNIVKNVLFFELILKNLVSDRNKFI